MTRYIFYLCPLILLTGCTQEKTEYYGTTELQHDADEIWLNLGAEPEYLDPNKISDNNGGEVALNTFAGLTRSHPEVLSAEPMPDLAWNWEITDGGKVYEFYLRKSGWSDGTPVTSKDFVYSWRRLLAPATGSKYSTFLYDIRNARPYNKGAIFLAGWVRRTG